MPIYTYQCENCGVRYERRQKFTDEPLKRSPECNQNELRKVYLPVGIVFKGSGFYSTDNRSTSGTTRQAKKSEKDTESTTSSDELKTDKKSSEKSE